MIDILWKMYVNYFKIFWLLRPIRNCVGNPWTINCRSERHRVSVWESIEGFKTLEQLINGSNQTTLSSKSARLKLVLRLFFLVVIRHFLCGLPLYFLSLVPVQCAICFMRKKKILSAKIESVQRAELRDTGSNWSYENSKSALSFTQINGNKKVMTR